MSTTNNISSISNDIPKKIWALWLNFNPKPNDGNVDTFGSILNDGRFYCNLYESYDISTNTFDDPITNNTNWIIPNNNVTQQTDYILINGISAESYIDI